MYVYIRETRKGRSRECEMTRDAQSATSFRRCAAVGRPEKGYLAVHRRWRTWLAREGRQLKCGEHAKKRWFCVKAALPASAVHSVDIARPGEVARERAGKRDVDFHAIQGGNVRIRRCRRCCRRRHHPPPPSPPLPSPLAAAAPAAPILSFTTCPPRSLPPQPVREGFSRVVSISPVLGDV